MFNSLPKSQLTLLINFYRKCGVFDINGFIERCTCLKNFLDEENKKFNLTRIQEEFDYWNKHVADSLSISIFFPELIKSKLTVMDIGCGAGFPTLVLAIAFAGLEITAIDSTKKKADFVMSAAKLLHLDNIKVIIGRCNELKLSQKFDLITARAVAEPYIIFKETKNFLKSTGKIIVYQTPKDIDEKLKINNRQTANSSLVWHATNPFVLPGGEQRLFVVGNKNNP